MTQLVSPSSRRGRQDPDARHAAPHHHHSGITPGQQGGSAAARGRHATTLGQGFGRIIGWTILGSLIPGAGLIAAGRRAAGRVVLVLAALLIAGLGVAALMVDPEELVKRMLSEPNIFLIGAGAMLVVFIGWIIVVLATHSAARRYGDLTAGQRVLSTALVVGLVGMVAVPTAVAANNAAIARDVILSVFRGSGPVSEHARRPDAGKADPWANVPRVNVLLMGGDSGLDRPGIRPDTMIVASIDTKTGETVLVSLPRNLQRVPFPDKREGARLYPNGFYCAGADGVNTECLLNSLWTWGDDHPQYYPDDDHPGVTATIEAIEVLTGLGIDEYVMLNLRGFADFIDAMGGLTLNVRERLPIGGDTHHRHASEWIKAGTQHLDGYHALWYARSRWSTDDYDRMRRQRCVIGAVVQQANPVALALNFGDIAVSLKKNFITSIPQGDINAWVTLAQRVKQAHVRSLAFTSSVINTSRPDVDKMNAMVEAAINPPPPSTTTPTPSAKVSPTKKAKTPKPAASDSTAAQDVSQVC